MIRTSRALLAIAAGLVLVLVSCGVFGSGPDEGASGEDGAEAGIRVAVVAPSAENDESSTQSLVEGLEAVSGVSDVVVSPGIRRPEDAAAAVRSYADDGYDLILAHSSEYGDAVRETAADFPGTAFAWGPASNTFGLDNVSSYNASSDEGGYVLGGLAAGMCSKIGVVGPMETGEPKLYADGFRLGAEAGGTEVDMTHVESMDRVEPAAQAAIALIRDGADCLTATTPASIGAIDVAERAGLLWFGTQTDQTPTAAAGVVVANQIYEWEVVLQDLVDDVAGGSLGGGIYGIDLANGGLVVEFGDVEATEEMSRLVSEISAQVIARDVATSIDG